DYYCQVWDIYIDHPVLF
nr:immunoglobulin light chain junction region [Macaca mulatta]MOV65823.1 immunoglobulin light chain junction region [Macaca mulatta]MOV65837.1 immunoglobulin light chain junction region [Macaca mulatta]MOV65867.1 immunoglobulin light chain junction region [Macaca mulatta]MOV65869.1 immunoglobulin light chain junction region [Macaca mulatta]